MQRYEKYKDSGIEWIGEIPEHWEVKRFSFLFSLGRGLSITKHDLKDLGIPCINYGEIHSKYGFEVNPEKHLLKCVDEGYLNLSINSLLKRGDFVFADTSEDIEGSGNFSCLESDIPTFAGYHTIIARLKYNYNYRFIAYFFDSLEFRTQIRREVTGIKVFSITHAILKNTNLILPTFQEQILIATYLDRKTSEIDLIIANKQKLIALYEEEKQAVINQAVTKGLDPDVKLKDSGVEWLGEIPENWEVKKLKYILDSVVGGGTPSTDNPLYWDGNIPWVSAKDMKFDLITSSEDYITDIAVSESSTNYIEDERIIIVVRSGILKHTFPVAINKVPICINQDLKALKVNAKITNEFFFWKLKGLSNEILTYCNKMGATVDSLDMSDLMNLLISFPNKNEQQSIVTHIEKECARLDAIISKFNKQIALLQEYRTTLISEVVTGKIKVCE